MAFRRSHIVVPNGRNAQLMRTTHKRPYRRDEGGGGPPVPGPVGSAFEIIPGQDGAPAGYASHAEDSNAPFGSFRWTDGGTTVVDTLWAEELNIEAMFRTVPPAIIEGSESLVLRVDGWVSIPSFLVLDWDEATQRYHTGPDGAAGSLARFFEANIGVPLNGTITYAPAPLPEPPVTDHDFWLDGQDTDAFGTDGDDNITFFTNKGGGGQAWFINNPQSRLKWLRSVTEMNGFHSVYFGDTPNAQSGFYLPSQDGTAKHTFFVAYTNLAGVNADSRQKTLFCVINDPVSGAGRADSGVNTTGAWLGAFAPIFVDGVDVTGLPQVEPTGCVVIEKVETRDGITIKAIGWQDDNNEPAPMAPSGNKGWTGYVGEVLTYARQLTDQERQDTCDYLTGKWGITPFTVPAYPTVTIHDLPVTWTVSDFNTADTQGTAPTDPTDPVNQTTYYFGSAGEDTMVADFVDPPDDTRLFVVVPEDFGLLDPNGEPVTQIALFWDGTKYVGEAVGIRAALEALRGSTVDVTFWFAP